MSAHPTAVLLALHGAVPMSFKWDADGQGALPQQWRVVSRDHRKVLWYMPSGKTWLIGTALRVPGASYTEVAWCDLPHEHLDRIPPATLDRFIS